MQRWNSYWQFREPELRGLVVTEYHGQRPEVMGKEYGTQWLAHHGRDDGERSLVLLYPLHGSEAVNEFKRYVALLQKAAACMPPLQDHWIVENDLGVGSEKHRVGVIQLKAWDVNGFEWLERRSEVWSPFSLSPLTCFLFFSRASWL